jgi:hypothetical protein
MHVRCSRPPMWSQGSMEPLRPTGSRRRCSPITVRYSPRLRGVGAARSSAPTAKNMERASFETDVRSYERADRTGDSEVSVPLHL